MLTVGQRRDRGQPQVEVARTVFIPPLPVTTLLFPDPESHRTLLNTMSLASMDFRTAVLSHLNTAYTAFHCLKLMFGDWGHVLYLASPKPIDTRPTLDQRSAPELRCGVNKVDKLSSERIRVELTEDVRGTSERVVFTLDGKVPRSTWTRVKLTRWVSSSMLTFLCFLILFLHLLVHRCYLSLALYR